MGNRQLLPLCVTLILSAAACSKSDSKSQDLATVDLTGGALGDLAATDHASPVDLPANDATPTTDDAGTDAATGLDSSAETDLPGMAPDLYVPVAALSMDHQPSHSFGDVVTGVPSGATSFVVTNAGPDSSGMLMAATITGTNASAFAIQTDGCVGQILAPSDSCAVLVYAQSNSPGGVSATLSVTGTPGGTATVGLTATIVTPGAIEASPSPAGFGSVQVGSSKDVTITFTNTGGSETGVLTFGKSGTGESEFAIIGGTCGSSTKLAASGMCTVLVRWSPLAAAVRSVTLTVSASPGGPVAVNMTGTSYTPAALAFEHASYTPTPNNPVDKGGSATMELVLHNNGTQASGPLPTLQTLAHTAFTVTGGTCQAGTPIVGGGSCTIQVTFAPTAFGAASDTLSVTATPGATASASVGGIGRETFKLTVKRLGTGTGSVSVDGTPCSTFPCTVDYTTTGTVQSVVVTETPDVSSTFGTWTTIPNVATCGAGSTCTVMMDRAREVDATFTLKTFTVTVAINGVRNATGQVSSNVAPAMTCNATSCTGTYPYGTNVTLTASATGGNLFQSWDATPCASRFSTTCATGVLNADFTTTVTFRPPINYAFLTSQEIDVATIGIDLVAADRLCDTLARNAGLVNTPIAPATPYFKALLATSAASARSRISMTKGWIMPNGREFASDPIDLFQQGGATKPAQAFYPLRVTEAGVEEGFSFVATGATATGDLDVGHNCNDWTTNLGCGVDVTLGDPQAVGDVWLFRQHNCGCTNKPLYCFETAQPATTIAPSPPAQKRTAFVSSGTFAGGTSRATADTLCSTDASNAGLSGTYVSLLPVTGQAATARLDLGAATWVRPDNTLIATTTTRFAQAQWSAPIAQLANGTYVTGFVGTWVGAATPGSVLTTDGQTCTSWTSSSGSSGYMLSPNGLDYYWLGTACSNALRVLCVQQ